MSAIRLWSRFKIVDDDPCEILIDRVGSSAQPMNSGCKSSFIRRNFSRAIFRQFSFKLACSLFAFPKLFDSINIILFSIYSLIFLLKILHLWEKKIKEIWSEISVNIKITNEKAKRNTSTGNSISHIFHSPLTKSTAHSC